MSERNVQSENVTIVDDPTDSSTLMAIPFDAEGTHTKKLPLIENGMAVSQCYRQQFSCEGGNTKYRAQHVSE